MKLIPLEAVLAKIEKLKGKVSDSSSYCNGWQYALRMLEIELNTSEVKEVDLEKEIKDYFDNQPIITKSKGVDYQLIPSGEEIAKHFFEFGLKASNSLTWEDIKLIWNITDEMDNMPEEEFYKEVLKRFKAQKGE